MFSIFEYFSSSENHKRKIEPLKIKGSPNKVLSDLKEHLIKNEFHSFELQERFYELFAKKDLCEYTFEAAPEGSHIILNVNVFSSKNGKSKKELKRILNELKILFRESII